MMENITEQLHEFQYLFPTNFFEMKEILGDLGEINISLKPNEKPVRKWLSVVSFEYKVLGSNPLTKKMMDR